MFSDKVHIFSLKRIRNASVRVNVSTFKMIKTCNKKLTCLKKHFDDKIQQDDDIMLT